MYQHGPSCAFKVVARAPRNQAGEERRDCEEDMEMVTRWRVTHPALLRLMGVIQDEVRRGYLFPFAESGDLMHWLISSGPLERASAVLVASRIALGLHALHSSTIAHRDVKPDNILLMDGGAPFASAVLADFGCAAFGAAAHTGCTELTGTFAYWAPEHFAVQAQCRESYGYRVDCWSLGVSLYSMCCGIPPFEDAPSQYEVPSYVLDTSNPEWQHLHPQLRLTIATLLTVDDASRISCIDAVACLRCGA